MIRAQSLSKRLGDFALRDISFEVAEGDYAVFLGPTASGKTVLLETLVGINQPDRGRVSLDDDDVTDWPPERRGIGFVYQRSMLFPHLSVASNIGYGLRYHRVPRHARPGRIGDLAELLGISGLLERTVEALSGGERQKVALARALAIRPRVLLLDEPLAPLDPVSKETLRGQLADLHRQTGTTILHVTHDQETARVLGRRIGILHQGRLLQFGSTDEVFNRPASAFVARFVGMENVFQGMATQARTLVRVELGSGSVFAETDLTGPVGLCVRPELIHLEPVSADAAVEEPVPPRSCIPGLLESSSDRGAVIRHRVVTAEEHFVVLQPKKEYASGRLAIGGRVAVTFGPEAVHVFPHERAAEIVG
ncbi:MAG: ABC transporter ATP-binding protein [Planctomycetota bacterium]